VAGTVSIRAVRRNDSTLGSKIGVGLNTVPSLERLAINGAAHFLFWPPLTISNHGLNAEFILNEIFSVLIQHGKQEEDAA